MGRDVGAGRDAVGLEQRHRHPGHRGLAVGADDVDRGEAVLWHPQQRAEPAHPLQAQAPADRLASGEDLFGASRLSAQLFELRPVGVELLALRVDHVGRAPWRRSPRCRACPRRARPRRAASRVAPRSAREPPRGRCPRSRAARRRRRSRSPLPVSAELDPREPADQLVGRRRRWRARRAPAWRGPRPGRASAAAPRVSSIAAPISRLGRLVDQGLVGLGEWMDHQRLGPPATAGTSRPPRSRTA